jgi:hypothetical protein
MKQETHLNNRIRFETGAFFVPIYILRGIMLYEILATCYDDKEVLCAIDYRHSPHMPRTEELEAIAHEISGTATQVIITVHEYGSGDVVYGLIFEVYDAC